ncbi:MAG: hypothetical protein ABWW69_06030 [Pyrodictiaceae archaeon]
MALEKGAHWPLRVHGVSDPRRCGARRSLGGPKRGKRGDYELILPMCARCHIQVFDKSLAEVHVDRISPLCDPIGHLVADAGRLFTSMSTLLGLAVLWFLGPSAAVKLLAALVAYVVGKL